MADELMERAEALAREVKEREMYHGLEMGVDPWLAGKIARALRAERTRALDDARQIAVAHDVHPPGSECADSQHGGACAIEIASAIRALSGGPAD